MSTEPTTEPASAAAHQPVTVHTPDSSLRQPLRLVQELAADLWSGRELAGRMFLRNLRGLYRQTFLGLFWAFLPPVVNTLVWVILRSTGAVDLAKNLPASANPETFSYALYVVTGMVIWQSFVESLQAPIQAVQSNRSLLGKIRFPRESILLVQFYEVLFNLGIRTIVLVALLIVFGAFSPGPVWAWVPLLVLLLILLGFGIGLILMPAAMLYNDVSRMITVILPVWMIVTPIIYLPPDNWASSPLNWLNPASPLLSVSRDLLVFGASESWPSIWFWALLAVPLLLGGLVLFRVSIPVLVERIS
jgi:lipopolysaccharide transport system permease protein